MITYDDPNLEQNCYNYTSALQVCMANCGANQYQDKSKICYNCPNTCTNCIDSVTCASCYDPACSDCPDNMYCDLCSSGFSFKGVCFPECPFFTTPLINNCEPMNGIQYFNFYILSRDVPL